MNEKKEKRKKLVLSISLQKKKNAKIVGKNHVKKESVRNVECITPLSSFSLIIFKYCLIQQTSFCNFLKIFSDVLFLLSSLSLIMI